MKPHTEKTLSKMTLSLAALLALGGCSLNDDDDDRPFVPAQNNAENNANNTPANNTNNDTTANNTAANNTNNDTTANHTTTNNQPSELNAALIDVSGLSSLRNGYHYENWVIIDDTPISVGRFNVDVTGTAVDVVQETAIPDQIFPAGRDISDATKFVITIEEVNDPDLAPSATKYLAGDIVDGEAVLDAFTAPAVAAEGDIASSTGKFILATPTDGSGMSDEMSGIWWISFETADPSPGLTLPAAPAGWAYEGWVVFEDPMGNPMPVSTGRFTDPMASDDNAPFSGTAAGGPPVPGEDFLMNAPAGLSFPTNLSEHVAVITLEPEPDDDVTPFALKPLVADIPANAADHQTLNMTNQVTDTFPTATVQLLAQ